MSGKYPRLNSLASRKQLLIAESELNRAQLVQEWQTMSSEVQALTRQAKTISSLVSSAASLIFGLMALGRKKSAPAAEKPSWWQNILKGAQWVTTIGQAFCPPPRDAKDK